MIDCFTCKSPKGCIGKLWYYYAEIKFCVPQVIWIIFHSDTFLEGSWPPNPEVSSYIDPKIQTGFRDEAYFAKPEEMIGEVEARLKTTGVSGEALIGEVRQGLGLDQLSRPARDALFYVRGWRRKRQSFSQWMAERNRGHGKTHKYLVLK